MEVHAHTHTPRKKWNHYFWEFLMLFLAVFAGFIAENMREHIIEKKKEKEYIHALVEDLRIDEHVLQGAIPQMEQTIRGLDTLISQVYLAIGGKPDTKLMYYAYHHYCRSVFNLELSEKTLVQLQNSGNMRLIHDKDAAQIILGMSTGFDILKEQTRFIKARQEDPASFGMKIFDFREYQKANVTTDGTRNRNDDGFLSLSYSPALNYTDPLYLKEFAARVGYYRNSFSEYVNYLSSGIPKIQSATNYLIKRYNIKEN